LLGKLYKAQAAGRLEDVLEEYLAPHVVVLDELGYLTYGPDAANHPFPLVDQRYLTPTKIPATGARPCTIPTSPRPSSIACSSTARSSASPARATDSRATPRRPSPARFPEPSQVPRSSSEPRLREQDSASRSATSNARDPTRRCAALLRPPGRPTGSSILFGGRRAGGLRPLGPPAPFDLAPEEWTPQQARKARVSSIHSRAEGQRRAPGREGRQSEPGQS
jgi:hypothetical protein